MARTPNLNGFMYFETVARRGTISRAAEEMSVSPSAVSQQIKLLEQNLGITLFRRKGRVLSLTLEGEQLFQSASVALRMLRESSLNFKRGREIYQLNMRVTPSFGVRWLGPRLSDFIAKHPDWVLHIDAAPDPTDFDREMMELDLRYGTGNWPGYHSEAVFDDCVLPLCSPSYLASLPKSADADALLSKARLICTPRALCQWDYWLNLNQVTLSRRHMPILMDRSSMAIQLAVDGVGVVLDSMSLAMPEINEGWLVPLLPQLPVLRFDSYFAICPTRYIKRRAVQEFLAWLKTQTALFDHDLTQAYTKHGLRQKRIEFDIEMRTAAP